MQHQRKQFEHAMLKANLPGETLPGMPLVEIFGKRRVLIENHSGVNCYTETEIHINSKLGCVQIFGDRLQLARVSKECLVITGDIHKVIFA